MANQSTNNTSFLWIEPKHLTPDELEYELKIRCLEFPGMPIEQQQQVLFTELCKEAQIPRILVPRKTLLEEVGIIEIKLMMIRHELEQKFEQKSITRLKHLYLRMQRTAATDTYQIQMKKDILEEIETLVEVFGSDRDAIQKDRVDRSEGNNAARRSALGLTTGAYRKSRMRRITEYEFPPPEQVPRSTEVNAEVTRQSMNPNVSEFRPQRRMELSIPTQPRSSMHMEEQATN